MAEKARRTVTKYFAAAGVEVDGAQPTDIQVRDPRFYTRVPAEGSIVFGEAYMEGWWDAGNLDGFITLLLGQRLDQVVRSWDDIASLAWARLSNLQRRGRAFRAGERHYDIGNDLYERMLDRRMIYSCAYWEGVDNLDAAQENKLDLVFGKLGLESGDCVLDIGCGWGGWLKYAVERYGVRGVGITVSKEQAELARASTAGMPIEIRLLDYREIDERFDHVFCIGMVRTRGPEELPHLPRGGAAPPEDGRAVPAAHRRHVTGSHHPRHRPAAGEVHLPERRAAAAAADPRRAARPVLDRGLAAHRPALRPHADGLARPFREGLAGPVEEPG